MGTASYDFSDERVLIVGGTSGIGLATARAFARSKARIAMFGLPFEGEDALMAELRGLGAKEAFFETVDVRQEQQMAAACNTVRRRFGGLEVAFNNAGVEAPWKTLDELAATDFDQVMSINARGVWLGMKYQIPLMRSSQKATIVNTSSTAGVQSIAMQGVYSASKHAIIGLTRAAALEQAANGIRVNAVAPGPVDTGLLTRMAGDNIDLAMLTNLVPARRISHTDEIATVVLWLASQAASYVTGAVVVVDGGVTIA